MRKFLSLVLALVMMMSLITINTGAVEFTDSDDITYQEAVDVISAIHVVDGYSGGDFQPAGNLTRGAAAKIICNLILGPTTAAQLHADTAPFRDVPVTHDFAGYIAYCQKEGIISGYGDGSFRPAGTLTGNAFMKMLLGALGYDAEIEQYVGPNWTINVAKRAIGIGLDKGLTDIFDGSRFITREEAALYALNTLKADMVEYESRITASVNGADVTIGNSTATSRTWQSQQTKRSNIYDDNLVQFAEQYFNKLVLTRDVDAFGRPDREWDFDGDSIGAYIDLDLLKQEWTVEVTGKDLYDLLGSNAIDNYEFQITIDGVDVDGKTGTTDHNKVLEANKEKTDANSYFDTTYMTRNYKSGVGQTGKGVLTQVFVEPGVGNTGKVWVAVINTFLAKATGDYSEKKDEISFDVFSMNHAESGANAVYFKVMEACKVEKDQKEKLTVTGEDFPEVTEMQKDDIVLVNVSNGSIEIISEPEVMSAATLTAFSKNSYLETEGDKYDYSTTVEYDVETLESYTDGGTQQLKDTEYDVYLDPYGYVIGVKVVEATNNYIFLTGVDQGASNLKNKTADAAGILTDGTFIEFQMNTKDSKQADGTTNFGGHPLWNTWCTYTVDKNNVYTLKEVGDYDAVFNPVDGVKAAKAGQYHDADNSNKTINDKNVSLKGAASKYVYGNDDSIYIVPELELIVSDTDISAGDVNMPDNATNGEIDKDDAAKDDVGIISGVDSIGVGIANVDLVTWDAAKIISELKYTQTNKAYPGNVYTLFDKDGYVVAAIVVGEDNGTSKTLAYSHKSDLEKESYSSADDEWTWTRYVIIDGEETLLTEKGDKVSTLDAMTQNTWYEVSYKADGTVKEAKHAYYEEAGKNAGTTLASDKTLTRTTSAAEGDAGNFVDDIKWVENAINNSNKSVVLYEEDWDDELTKAPSLIASTLYVDTENMMGFYVSQNVKSVLIQKNDGKSTTSYGDGMSDLEGFLDDLNKKEDGTYSFKISAILTNGRATTVIIHDWNETEATASEKPVNDAITGTDWDSDNEHITIYYEGEAPSRNEQLETVIDMIKRETGAERIEGASLDKDGNFTGTAVKEDGSSVTVTATVGIASKEMTGDGANDMMNDMETQPTDPYETMGSITMDEDDKTITFTGGFGADGQTTGTDSAGHTVSLMTNISRFLGGLYRTMGVRTIGYKGYDYKWDPTNAAADSSRDELAGSNWYSSTVTYTDGGGNTVTGATLVSRIVADSADAIVANGNTIDGVSFTLTLDGVRWTVEIALG